MTKKAEEYSADTLLTLDDRTHLIKRMGLTFGPEGTNPDYPYSQQKTVAVREIIDNSTDEIRSGYGSHVRLTIRADHGVEVMDSGRGIPVDVNHTTHESGIYMSLGKTQSGGKFSTDSNRFTSGLNGVGGGSVALVSQAMFVTVYRAGKRYSLDFHNGLPGFFAKYGDPTSKFTSLKGMGKDNSYLKVEKDTRPASVRKDYKTGTTVLFWLDDSAFVSSKPIDDLDLVNRLKFTAFLTPELSAEAIDECHPVDGEPLHEQFHYPDGIVSMWITWLRTTSSSPSSTSSPRGITSSRRTCSPRTAVASGSLRSRSSAAYPLRSRGPIRPTHPRTVTTAWNHS